uniref:Uncharacterized protein n=1 Tax=Romanomermis culicivorax TaxID=13658 RepID=A0A915KHH3_ROMCU
MKKEVGLDGKRELGKLNVHVHRLIEHDSLISIVVSKDELLNPGKYKGYLMTTFIDLNSPTKISSIFRYVRPLNSRWNYHPISALNYTVDKLPVFQSYNPLSGSFLAEPNTMPWMVSLTEGYAVLLNESEISGIGRKDRTRFVLTTCGCQKQM